MIFGIGTDIVEVQRFSKWVENPEKLNRFFNKAEQKEFSNNQLAMEHYAARFAAKEAFGKALGIGITDFSLVDVYIENDALGKPELKVMNSAKEILDKICGDCKIHISLSHEKFYAIAYLIIEK